MDRTEVRNRRDIVTFQTRERKRKHDSLLLRFPFAWPISPRLIMSPRRKWNTSTSGTRRPPVIRGWWDRGVRRAGDKPVVSSRRWKTCETVANPIAVRAGSARLRELARSYRGKNDNGPWRAVDKLPACPTNRRNVEKFSREWLLVKWRGKKKKKKKGVNGIGRSARFRRQIWDYFSNELHRVISFLCLLVKWKKGVNESEEVHGLVDKFEIKVSRRRFISFLYLLLVQWNRKRWAQIWDYSL